MMLIQFTISFGVLALLGLSYYLRRHTSTAAIPFSLFWCLLLTTYIAVLSVGLLHVHFDCMFLWSDCYARGYPNWLFLTKPLILWSPSIWSVIALVIAVRNFGVHIFGGKVTY